MGSNEISAVSSEPTDNGELFELGKRLIAAAKVGDSTTVFELMKYGAPFATDWWGLTSLHHAALGGHLETCELLVKSGILRDARSKVEKTPLHLACQEGHAEVVLFLITHGADVDATDMIYMTPLHWAVEMKHEQTVQILLQNGANPNKINKFDKTCYDVAIDKGSEEMLELLQGGPREGEYTVQRREEHKMSDLIKRWVPTIQPAKNSVRRTFEQPKAMVMPAVMKRKTSSVLPKKAMREEEEIRQLLEEHGIEMLEGEDINIVASAVDSGQTVILTEAGRQALTLTDSSKPKSANSNATVKVKEQPTPSIANKRPHSPEEDVMATVASVSQKYLQAKHEADQYKLLYAKKRREVEEYQNKLQLIALKTLKRGDVNVELMEEAVEGDDDGDILLGPDDEEDDDDDDDDDEEEDVNKKVSSAMMNMNRRRW